MELGDFLFDLLVYAATNAWVIFVAVLLGVVLLWLMDEEKRKND